IAPYTWSRGLTHFSPIGRSEQMADAGCFGLLIPALLFWISADRRRLALGRKDRPTEVPGKRRTQLRDWLAWNTSVVLRQRRNTVGDIVMVGTVKLIGRRVSVTIVLQRPQHGSADDKQGDRAPSRKYFA
ncbi:unnamed protein product, partial [marine sediment metagenome]